VTKCLNKKKIFRLPTFKGDNLGNIRQTFIKNIAIDLIKEYPDQFKHDDFQHNKEKVSELSDVSSKLLRNRIAGYITRRLANKNKGATGRPISE
jgi:small subunit ribosomal protein S17e